MRLNEETVLSLPGLEINLDQRKVSRNQREIVLTAKEYAILCLLAVNKNRVLTHSQIYEEVWNDIAFGNERKAVGYHIYNLRRKLCCEHSSSSFKIENVREIGYRIKIST